MLPTRKTFYQYLGLHSLLIGIFPFYIPVYIWKQGFGVGEISLFISLAGLGFCGALWVWDRLRFRVDLTTLIGISLLLEILLLYNVHVMQMSRPILLVLGITYGLYNCFYWTTQRALFFDLIDIENSGKKYGNFQIFVGVLLQLGILMGAFLLEWTNFVYLVWASVVIAVIGFFIVVRTRPLYPVTLSQHASLTVRDILGFRDNENSRLVFVIDGLFLFAESFFWLITLFMLAHESFTTLGLMVLSLAVIFGILFFLLKNTIDRLGRKYVYILSVGLYALSWALRAITDNHYSLEVLFLLLVVITFSTSFFRLAMNKRFYDIAKLTRSHDYLVLKSYYTQMAIVVMFGAFGFGVLEIPDSEVVLVPVYWACALLAFLYLLYGTSRYNGECPKSAPERPSP